jgi:hypothetical protein
MRKWLGITVAGSLAIAILGCGAQDNSIRAGGSQSGASDFEQLIVQGDAPEAMQVGQAKAEAGNGEPVTVSGRVKDFVDGAAVFTIADSSLKACSDNGDACCDTPWDYCCIDQTKVASMTATVRLVSAENELLSGNVKGTRNLDHLSRVTAEGTAERDDAGNLIVNAHRVYLLNQ